LPIYEYRCLQCGRISSHLVLSPSSFDPFCKYCNSKDVKKVISRVNVRLSEETRLERALDPSLLGAVEDSNLKSIKRAMEKMGSIVGDEVEGNFNEMVEEAVEEASSIDSDKNSSCTNDTCDL